MHSFKLAPKMLYKKTRVIMFIKLCWGLEWLCACCCISKHTLPCGFKSCFWTDFQVYSTLFASSRIWEFRDIYYLVKHLTLPQAFTERRWELSSYKTFPKAADNLFHISALTFKRQCLKVMFYFPWNLSKKFIRAAITKEMTEHDTAWCLNSLHHKQIFN